MFVSIMGLESWVLHMLGSYFTTSYTSWASSFVFKRGKKSLSTTGVEILVQLLAFQSNNLDIPMSICVFLMVQS